MDLWCATRAIKNARQLQRRGVFPEIEPEGGFERLLPVRLLGDVHRPRARWPHDVDRALAERVRDARLAQAENAVVDPLFNGTAVFLLITFTLADGSTASVNAADTATAIAYATAAADPIGRYASQYGPNALAIAAQPLAFAVTLTATTFTDADLQGWVNAVAQQNGLGSHDCLVILNPPAVTNSDAALSSGILGYHSYANLPYAFVNVVPSGGGVPFTVDDRADQYALALSHELAELLVDPLANNRNPEVCDPCAGNCNVSYREFFRSGTPAQYVGGDSQTFPPPFAYDFFVSAVVAPADATACPAPSSGCAYAPPAATGA